MLGSEEIAVFVATTDAAKAAAFYRDVLGLKLVEDTPFAVVFDANGRTLRMQKVESFTPQPFTTLGWGVRDIVATMAALAAKGVTFERYAGMDQDDAGVWSSPGWRQDRMVQGSRREPARTVARVIAMERGAAPVDHPR